MKYSTAMLSLAAVATAQPAFTNLDFNVVEGQPFTLTFSGCEGGCTIILANGESGDLQDVEELTSSASGGEFTFTPESLPSDQYAFEIVNNETGENNYSEQFQYEGEEASVSTSVVETTFTSTATVPVTETSETSTPEVTTTTSALTTMITSASTGTLTSTVTEEATTTVAETSTGETTAPTQIPEGAGATIGSPLTLVVAAVAGLFMFN